MLQTRVCRTFDLHYPIVQAGMAVHTSPDLVAAVSNAGGLGLIGSAFRELAAMREPTDRPFDANVVLAEPNDELLEILPAERVPVISSSWSDPDELVDRSHAMGLRAMHQVEAVAETRCMVGLAPDAIIAQGPESGGQVGRVGTLALVPAVVDAARDIPVIAEGGAADGRGLEAALMLGAEGVLIGTRFLATREAPVPESWKQTLLRAAPEDAWQIDVPDLVVETHWAGATARVLANALLRTWHGREDEIEQRRETIRSAIESAESVSDAEGQFLYAGQSAGLIDAIVPAGDVVRTIATDAAACLRSRVGGSDT
jgi:nitronate monooxygenase/enoyl-[acyl-carrier protein] reductase II